MFMCPRCGYKTNIKGNLRNHFNRKKLCEPVLSNTPIGELLAGYSTSDIVKSKINTTCDSGVSQRKSDVSQNVSQRKSDVSQCKSDVSQCKSDANECKFCRKIFKHRQSRYNHEKYNRCKSNVLITSESTNTPVNIDVINVMNQMQGHMDDLQREKEEMKKVHTEEIGNLIDKVGNNITTNIENQHINININNYGNENLDYLTPKYFQKLLNIPHGAIINLIKYIHFNPDHPENHNIKITNKKLPYASIYKEEKWVYTDKKDIIDNIVDKSYNLLDEHYTDKKYDLDNYVTKNYEIFQMKYDNDDKKLKKQLSKDSELIILNKSF